MFTNWRFYTNCLEWSEERGRKYLIQRSTDEIRRAWNVNVMPVITVQLECYREQVTKRLDDIRAELCREELRQRDIMSTECSLT